MRPRLNDLAGRSFDVLVIGGGACGAAVARESALRGFSTALVEKGDFGEGASAHCLKMVHGGIRYLQHLDVARLRHSCRERAALLRLAPHLVAPLPIAVPTYGWGRHGKPFLGAGMMLFDLLSADRNGDITDPARRIAATRFLSPGEVLDEFPTLERRGLTGAAVFEDGQMYSTTRLVWAFIDAARQAGATVANYVAVERLLRRGDRIEGAAVRDRLSGVDFDVRARVVINASGPWAEGLLEATGIQGVDRRGTYSRDACFVLDRQFPGSLALAIQGKGTDSDSVIGRGARHMFLAPWRDKTLVGVWHRPLDRQPDEVRLPGNELQIFVDEINAILPGLNVTLRDVRMAGFGLVPFGKSQQGGTTLSFGHESKLIDHAARDRVRGLVTVVSVRYTVARQDASAALDLVAAQAGRKSRPGDSTGTPLPGGAIGNFSAFLATARLATPDWLGASGMESLVRNYGTLYPQVLGLAAAQPGLARRVDGTDVSFAEVAYVCRNELVTGLADIVFRRTQIGTGEAPSAAAIEQVEQLVRDELGATEADLERDRAATARHLERYWASRVGAGHGGRA